MSGLEALLAGQLFATAALAAWLEWDAHIARLQRCEPPTVTGQVERGRPAQVQAVDLPAGIHRLHEHRLAVVVRPQNRVDPQGASR